MGGTVKGWERLGPGVGGLNLGQVSRLTKPASSVIKCEFGSSCCEPRTSVKDSDGGRD